MSDQEILKHGICAVPKLLFKHCWDGNFELDIEAYRPIFHECIRVVGEDYINSMLDYATSITDLEVGEKLYKFVEEIFQDKQKSIMTYGQFLKQEGIQEGIQQGLQTGIANVAKNMIIKGFALNTIQEITGLKKETIEKLKPSKN